VRYFWCVLLIAITLAGCGGRGHTYVPVTGTVKYSDGTVPKGDIASITFQPASVGPDYKGASGSITPDGTFSLTTIDPGDGARPGEYVVKVNVFKGYPDRKSLVANKPLTATVTEDGENHFDFVVERQ
jgi:predicted small lipoprotein YifL